MREIKFRAKDMLDKNGQWLYGFPLIWKDGETYINHDENENESFCKSKVIADTLCQFTGLKDKNGVEIYEGDIIKDEDATPALVVFKDGLFGFTYTLITRGFVHHFVLLPRVGTDRSRVDFEVIGNIHDNAELLTDIK